MQLDQYISDLLYRYECVILPNFGAFLTQYKSARVHECTNAFYPPQKRLSFNAQLTNNDGLLANYIATTEMIPHEEANDRIATYVRFLFDSLHRGETQLLENIGSLSLNAESNVQFEPSYHLNYLTDAFGLSSFTTPQIARAVYKEEVTALEEKAPIAITHERRSSNWFKYAVAGMVVLGGIGLAGYNYVQNVEAHNYAAQQEADLQLEGKIQEATFVIENPLPAVTLAVLKPVGKYHIVAGAFRQEENASKKVAELRDKGFKARQIGVNRYGLHQVVYGSYTDGQSALKDLRRIRTSDNKAAWLLVKEIE